MKSVPIERRGDYIVKMYELDEDVCRQMLARCTFGRVAFGDADEGLSILPVNFLFSHDAVLFRTQAGSALDRLGRGRVVAFEADQIDPTPNRGGVCSSAGWRPPGDPDRIAALAEAVPTRGRPVRGTVGSRSTPSRSPGGSSGVIAS